MKGIVFSEFIELAEEHFSPEITDQMIESADLSSGGAYTSVDTYDPGEMAALLAQLSRLTSLPVAKLLKTFGRHLFQRFHTLYPAGLIEESPRLAAHLAGHFGSEVRSAPSPGRQQTGRTDRLRLKPVLLSICFPTPSNSAGPAAGCKSKFARVRRSLARGRVDRVTKPVPIAPQAREIALDRVAARKTLTVRSRRLSPINLAGRTYS
ncbi:MAG: heme NO-binding domain-containing protein [Chromatiales bacterium]|nr:heme NO-binding domain-containing protein [Chromatiales bacterium]